MEQSLKDIQETNLHNAGVHKGALQCIESLCIGMGTGNSTNTPVTYDELSDLFTVLKKSAENIETGIDSTMQKIMQIKVEETVEEKIR